MQKTFPKFIKSLALYPFLLGIFPVLFLWLNNIGEITFTAILRSLLIAFALTCLFYLIARLIFRSPPRAAVFCSLLIVFFFSYGHLFGFIDKATVGSIIVGRHRYFFPLWLVLFMAGTVAIWKAKSDLRNLSRVLAVFSFVLVAEVLLQAAYYELRGSALQASQANQQPAANLTTLGTGSNTQGRDVYYILMDSYSRQDVLQGEYRLDNQPFLQELTDLGFVIPNCTLSNYATTVLSMSVTLNMNYLDKLGFNLKPEATVLNTQIFINDLQKSLVRRNFEALGYMTVTFKALYPYIDIQDSDYYYDFEKTTSRLDNLESLNFQYLFFRTTLLRMVIESQEFAPDLFKKVPPVLLSLINPKASLFSSRAYRQYEQNLYAFDMLEKVPTLPGKKFVYAHLFDTHQPLVFNPDGTIRTNEAQDNSAYRDAVIYTNTRLIEVVKSILSQSKTPPIIIIQGDHSYTWSKNRNRILNAYYLPDGGNAKVYPTITPVNTFRLVFDQYFGGNYEFVPDQSYYSKDDFPYAFEKVASSCVK